MLIDFHAHAFADRIARRAMDSLIAAGGGLDPLTDGTVESLKEYMAKCGTDHAVLLTIATKPTQQTIINNWAAEQNHGNISAFGSVHPDAPDIMEELERIKALGLKGIKLHPEYQGFEVDDPKMLPVYRKIASLGLITVFHAGIDIGFMPPPKSTPGKIANVLHAFDGAPVVAAHFGSYMMWEDVMEKLCGKPVYIDTSYAHSHIPKPYAQMIIDRHGPDKMLFATDVPWSDAIHEKMLIESLDLTAEDREKIYWKNAAQLLGL